MGARSCPPSAVTSSPRCPRSTRSTASSTSTCAYAQCRERWPYGLGRYLLEKLAESMTKDGVLTVGKKEGASGQFVYMSGKSVGLSNKLDSFAAIGARVHHYQDALAKLSAKLPTKKVVEPLAVPPPEWEGN